MADLYATPLLRADWLIDREQYVTSQYGEDGLIAATFEKIGERSRCCFEVGAGNGVNLSNTWAFRQAGWKACLIESNVNQWRELQQQASDDVECHLTQATPDNFTSLLADFSSDYDLGVIDVDGQDYHLWNSLAISPRVMLVEFNPYRKDNFIPPRNDNSQPYTVDSQATFWPIVKLGIAKGYQLVATTFCNCLFVLNNACP